MHTDIESISHQIKERVDSKIYILLEKISVHLAYDFMFSHKYEVSHEEDPPWDYSGRLIQVDRGFSLEEYLCIGDFLEEYTGESMLSFESRCGFFHTRFEEKYENMIHKYIYDCCKEVLSDIGDEKLLQLLLEQGVKVSEEDMQYLIETAIEEDLFEEPLLYHYEIFEHIKSMNFKLTILRGKEEAIKKYKDKEKRSKENRERLEMERQNAKKLWSKLQNLYKLQTGKMIQKVEMRDYEMFKHFLDYNQVTKEDRVILATHLIGFFSNKVCEYLKR